MSPETGLKRGAPGFLSPGVAVGDGTVGKRTLGPPLTPTCLLSSLQHNLSFRAGVHDV